MRPTDVHRTALRKVNFFSALGDQECDDLLRCLRERRLAAGEVLFQQSTPGDTLVIAIEGALAVRVRKPDGGEIDVGHVRAGEVLGEMACIDPAPRSATVTATEATLIYELSRDGLEALRGASPTASAAVVGAVIREVTRRLREIDGRIDRLLGVEPVGGPVTRSFPPPRSVPPASLSPRRPTDPPPPPSKTGRSGFWGFVDKLRGAG